MVLLSFLSTSALVGLASSYAILKEDGFPAPSKQQLLGIESAANGRLPDGPPPTSLSPDGMVNFQLIAFNENFEVAYFSSLIDNITNGAFKDFQSESVNTDKDKVLSILKTVKAQEELHAISAANILKNFKAPLVPEPCNYTFPTTTFKDAVDLANLFTEVVLGTLQDASQSFAKNGDDEAVRAVSAIVGQEAQQSGFYRIFLDRMPASQPFLTTGTAPFAYSALQQFVDACPFNVTDIPIPIYPMLKVLTKAEAKDMMLSFSVDITVMGGKEKMNKDQKLFITYLNGGLQPISMPIMNANWMGDHITFDAMFPFTDNLLQGLTIAALTNSSTFDGPDSVPNSTIAAPGLIQVNDVFAASKAPPRPGLPFLRF